MAATTTATPLKTGPQEGQKNLKFNLDDSNRRKSSLVQGELADLEARRREGKSQRAFHHHANLCCDDLRYTFKILRQNPRILIRSFLVFAFLCGCGLGLVFFLAKDQNEEDKNLALDLAAETGRWFCKCGRQPRVSFADGDAIRSHHLIRAIITNMIMMSLCFFWQPINSIGQFCRYFPWLNLLVK